MPNFFQVWYKWKHSSFSLPVQVSAGPFWKRWLKIDGASSRLAEGKGNKSKVTSRRNPLILYPKKAWDLESLAASSWTQLRVHSQLAGLLSLLLLEWVRGHRPSWQPAGDLVLALAGSVWKPWAQLGGGVAFVGRILHIGQRGAVSQGTVFMCDS